MPLFVRVVRVIAVASPVRPIASQGAPGGQFPAFAVIVITTVQSQASARIEQRMCHVVAEIDVAHLLASRTPERLRGVTLVGRRHGAEAGEPSRIKSVHASAPTPQLRAKPEPGTGGRGIIRRRIAIVIKMGEPRGHRAQATG